MPKYYVSSCNHNRVLQAASPRAACLVAIKEWAKGEFAFGKVIQVSEQGWDTHPDDVHFCSVTILAELDVDYREGNE